MFTTKKIDPYFGLAFQVQNRHISNEWSYYCELFRDNREISFRKPIFFRRGSVLILNSLIGSFLSVDEAVVYIKKYFDVVEGNPDVGWYLKPKKGEIIPRHEDFVKKSIDLGSQRLAVEFYLNRE